MTQLQRTGGNNPQIKTVAAKLEKMKTQLASALPKHISPDRMARIALTEIRKNPALLRCDIHSLLGAVMQASQLGLEPGLMGQAYLIPFKNQVQFIIGYKGLIDLARRSGDVKVIYAHPVYENDEFEYSYGVGGTLKHVPARGDRGKVSMYYAYAELKDGGYAYEVMSVKDVEKHRDKFALYNKPGSPWHDDFDSMACKTVVRQMMKYMPMSVELSQTVAVDGTVRPDVKDEPVHIELEHDDVVDSEEVFPGEGDRETNGVSDKPKTDKKESSAKQKEKDADKGSLF